MKLEKKCPVIENFDVISGDYIRNNDSYKKLYDKYEMHNRLITYIVGSSISVILIGLLIIFLSFIEKI